MEIVLVTLDALTKHPADYSSLFRKSLMLSLEVDYGLRIQTAYYKTEPIVEHQYKYCGCLCMRN